MSRTILALTFICLWGFSLSKATEQRDKPQQSRKAESQKLAITGVLRKRDGTPAVGVKVFIFPYSDGKVIHGVTYFEDKKEFGLSNPQGTSDSEGRFTIEFSKDYLNEQKTDDFCVGLFKYGAADPVVLFKDIEHAHVTPILNISVFEKRKGRLDLNEIFKKIVVE